MIYHYFYLLHGIAIRSTIVLSLNKVDPHYIEIFPVSASVFSSSIKRKLKKYM